jgi:hypothetical protein
MFLFRREANMSFFIPPSPQPDPDWALVPGNHTDFYHVSIIEHFPKATQALKRGL